MASIWDRIKHALAVGPGGSEVDAEPSAPTQDSTADPPRWVGALDTVLIPAISRMTPKRLQSILIEADDGRPERLFESIMQIPQRDGHWRGVTKQRRLSVAEIAQRAVPLDDTATAKRAAEAMTAYLATADARIGRRESLTGLEFGFAVNQIRWDREGPLWRPRQVSWDPRYFEVSDNGDEILRRDEGGDLIPLMPGSWIVHKPLIGLGVTPVQRGLGRIGLLWTMLKFTAINQWWQFADVFGIPLRVVTIKEGDSMAQARKEARKVASDGVMVLRMGQKYDVTPNTSADGGRLFPEQFEFCNREMSVAVLTQTMTTNDGSSRSQAEVHERGMLRVRNDDAQQLADSTARDLYRWFCVFNFGMPADAPYTIEPVIPREETPEQILEAATRLRRDHGVLIDQNWLASATMQGAPYELTDPPTGALATGGECDHTHALASTPQAPGADGSDASSFAGLADMITTRAAQLERPDAVRTPMTAQATEARLGAEAGRVVE